MMMKPRIAPIAAPTYLNEFSLTTGGGVEPGKIQSMPPGTSLPPDGEPDDMPEKYWHVELMSCVLCRVMVVVKEAS